MLTVCVLREVNFGFNRFFPVSEVDDLKATEPVFVGEFVQIVGRSKGQDRSFYTPKQKPDRSTFCVVRAVEGEDRYVPVNEVPQVFAGERIVAGAWRLDTMRVGPSGSHERTVCSPVGATIEFAAA